MPGVERDMGCPGEPRLVGRRDNLRVETLRHVRDRRHDALVVHDHRIQCAGKQHQFLHEMVAGHRQALAHLQFVAGAAQPDEVDTLCALLFRHGDELGIFGGLHDDVRQQRVVAMQRDIDTLNAQRTEIDPRHDGFRRTEHHVGQLRRDHGATPAIGEARPQRVQRGVRVVVIDAHVRPVEQREQLRLVADLVATGLTGGK